ncbi:unnamed protein product [Darwinula stevensoni]|uniref:Cytochrome P450 n=1 Tax=Darwinula stevensoni TaxID=69355 RepID=A0A7R9A7G4_9CRUS|nr:unnamed protein product [Darwinula stevensoni]CAG0893259.1 unnamed protein product [Darwinula stevensoni]
MKITGDEVSVFIDSYNETIPYPRKVARKSHKIFRKSSRRRFESVDRTWGLPLQGIATWALGKNLCVNFDTMREKHGDIFTVGLLHKNLVVLSNWELVRDIFERNEISGRPEGIISRKLAFGRMGIAAAEGSFWQDNRRFTVRILKDFGFGKREVMNSMIQDAALTLCRFLGENQHKPQDLGPRLNLAIINIIWRMIADKQLSHDDAKMQDIMIKIEEVFNDANHLRFFDLFPFLVYLWPPALRACRRMDRSVTTLSKIFSEEIKDHKKNLSLSEDPKDFIDAYLTEMARQKARGEINPNFSEFELQVIISDLFIAGSETTTNTIRWCVLFLLCHPEIQEKLQAEVDSVVGPDRLPSLDDRDRMQYTQAFMMEVLRLGVMLPVGAPHAATEDTEVAGFLFPKGTIVFANVWACHMDPKFWPDPGKFDPGRFLNPDGTLKTKVPSYFPFSLGKRQCPGESVALMEIFLFMAIFMQKFTFRTTIGLPHPKPESVPSLPLNHPQPFQFLVGERKLWNKSDSLFIVPDPPTSNW